MKHVPQDKYNVAWFTLAEFIARGEKVRALGVYRLLAHSIENTALRHQLEGDILLAFQDKVDAINKYKDAALLYQKHGKFLEAAALYEHLRDLEPNICDHSIALVELYERLGITSKVASNLRHLCTALMQGQDLEQAERMLEQLDTVVTCKQTAHEHEQIAYALIRSDCPDENRVLGHIRAAISGFLDGDDSRALQKFMSALTALSTDYAAHAHRLIEVDEVKA